MPFVVAPLRESSRYRGIGIGRPGFERQRVTTRRTLTRRPVVVLGEADPMSAKSSLTDRGAAELFTSRLPEWSYHVRDIRKPCHACHAA